MKTEHKLTGSLHHVGDIQTFASGFQKREFVITIDKDSDYPQHIKFEILKDKCSLVDHFEIGDVMEVSFNFKGNEYNGKYYTNLVAWKIFNANQGQRQSPQRTDPPQQDPAMEMEEDLIPF